MAASRSVQTAIAERSRNASERIEAVLAGKIQDPEAPHWSDAGEKVIACSGCQRHFTLFNRRHHCRLCGRVFCAQCSSATIRLEEFQLSKSVLRTCDACHEAFLRAAQRIEKPKFHPSSPALSSSLESPYVPTSHGRIRTVTHSADDFMIAGDETSSQLRSRRQTLPADPRRMQRASGESAVPNTAGHSPLAARTPTANGTYVSRSAVRDLWLGMHASGPDALPVGTHRYHFRSYDACVPGNLIVEWLLRKHRSSVALQRSDAVLLAQKLLEAGFIECCAANRLTDGSAFHDTYMPYRLREPSAEFTTNAAAMDMHGTDPGSNHIIDDDDSATVSALSLLRADPEWLQDINTNDASPTSVHGGKDDRSFAADEFKYAEDHDKPVRPIRQSERSFSTSMLDHNDVHREAQSLFYAPRSPSVDTDINHIIDRKVGDAGSENVNKISKAIYDDHDLLESDSKPKPVSRKHATLPRCAVDAVETVVTAAQLDEDAASTAIAKKMLERLFMQRFDVMLQQQLTRYRLRSEWFDVIKNIAEEVAVRVKPHMQHRESATAKTACKTASILHYVHVKKLPGGTLADCRIIYGVAFSKHVVNKLMRKNIDRPAVCLYNAALEHHSRDSLASLEPALQHETEFQLRLVSKLTALKPDVLLVRHGVSRLAQDFLLNQEGVSLLQNVKPSVMERLARHTDAELIPQLDENETRLNNTTTKRPRLGTCRNFRIEEIELNMAVENDDESKTVIKPLAVFDGCPAHTGCTILLRGESLPENLVAVKHIMRLAILYSYNRHLEAAFLVSEYAQPTIMPETLVKVAEREPVHSGGMDFRDALQRVAVSLSPFVDIRRPFAESDDVQHVAPYLRPFMPMGKFHSFWTNTTSANEISSDSNRLNSAAKSVSSMRQQWDRQKSHSFDFLNRTLTQPAKNASVQTMLAQLRAHYAHNWRNGIKRERPLLQLKNNSESPSSCSDKKPSSLVADCLDPFEHSRLTVLHSVYVTASSSSAAVFKPQQHSHSHQQHTVFCVRPHIVDMHFYADNDVTLGQYVDTITSNDRTCTTCNQPNIAHVHQFVHNGSCIRISLQQQDETSNAAVEIAAPVQQRRNANSGGKPLISDRLAAKSEEPVQAVFMRSTCTVCRESTPSVLMDEEALMLSLAKYLELQFLAPSYLRRSRSNNHCGHSLHQTHVHYFQKGNTVAVVKFSSAGMKLIRYPARIISLGTALAYNCAALLPPSSSSSPNHHRPAGSPTPIINEADAVKTDVASSPSISYTSRNRNKSFSNVFTETADSPQQQPKTPQTVTLVRNALVKQVKDVIVSGYGMYERVNERLQALRDACGAPGSQSYVRFETLQFALEDEQRTFRERHEAIQVKLASPWLRSAGELGGSTNENSRPSSRSKRISTTVATDQEQEEIGGGGGQTSSSSSATGEASSSMRRIPSSVFDADTPPTVPHNNSATTLPLADDDFPTTNSRNQHQDDRNAVALRTVMKIECALFDLKKFICEAARSWTATLPEWLQQRKKEEREERKQMRHTATVAGELARFISTAAGTGISSSGGGAAMSSSSKSGKLPVINIADSHASAGNDDKVADAVLEESLVHAKSSPFLTMSTNKPETAANTVMFDTFQEEESLYNDEKESDSASVGTAEVSADHISHDSGLLMRNSAEADEEAGRDSSVASTTPTGNTIMQAMAGDAEQNSSSAVGNSPVRVAAAATIPSPSVVPPALVVNMKALATLVNTPVPFPFPASQHYLLPPTHERYVAPILDDEPSSLIAFALCSAEYNERLQALIDEAAESTHQQQQLSSNNSAIKSNELSRQTSKSPAATYRRPAPTTEAVSHRSVASAAAIAAGMLTFDVEPSPLLQRKLLELEAEAAAAAAAPFNSASASSSPSSPHIEIQFSDPSTRFFCRIYFAREFHALRQAILGDGEDRFVRSLSRSVRWHASGGKSGSEFSKTVDERFVIKQLSKIEIGSFLDFGPSYVNYVLQRIGEGGEKASTSLPLCLAKIVGVYKIGLRNAHTGAAFKQDVLVMENLFYKRFISQVYDLKGSLRNRLADVGEHQSAALSTTAEQVLLDENYLRLSIDAPLYVRPEVKRCLNAVIQRDSEFLMSHSVMDYSLLVGVDDTRHELVVGIIDYIRTFTWHKRLEMMVKSSGFLGGQGRMPTIVSPNLYQARFCEAMQRYFLPVPDKWYRFGCGDVGGDDSHHHNTVGEDFAVDDYSEEAARRRVEDLNNNNATLLNNTVRR